MVDGAKSCDMEQKQKKGKRAAKTSSDPVATKKGVNSPVSLV
jgi:hypothetical protein